MRKWIVVIAVLASSCDKAKQEPAPAPTPTPTPPPTTADATTAVVQNACDAVLVFLETGGTWIGAPPDLSCFGPNAAGEKEHDVAWLKTELESLRTRLSACKPVLEVAAANGVTYQEMISILDVGLSIGFADVQISNPVDLSMKFVATKQPKCDGPVTSKRASSSMTPGAKLSKELVDLKAQPVIIVTKDEIKLGEETILSITETLGDSNKRPIPELQRAIPAGSKLAILQADASTDAKVINRIMKSTLAAGVDDLLLAVKYR